LTVVGALATTGLQAFREDSMTDRFNACLFRSPGPLAGVRIVEFDAIGPVPLAGMILADMGAEVVRLARRSGGAWAEVGGAVLNRGRPHVSAST
jgi:crotonobetainyl-CoA:carnitine CoA-transferase CaiB-like acyl-CoA transferase